MVDSNEAFFLWVYLLPGFVGLLAYEALAEAKKRDTLDRVGLIVAFNIGAVVVTGLVFGGAISPLTEITQQSGNVYKVVGLPFFAAAGVALLLGVLFAALRNLKLLYWAANKLHISYRTGGIDPWHEAFSSKSMRGKWIQLRYKDGTRLIGYPKFYAEDSEAKALFVGKASWHTLVTQPDNSQAYVGKDVAGPGVLVSNFDDIIAIDVLEGV